ncbi:PREDICTED: uncharacterized protein LOC109169394 [Ipomoea nil]|uniref:uncharacterized protein LOC109169394 n=1 Tax=Ipomoea nil TaxID=35883 RepID=UPI00090110AF|nr:PREDICTED: uncharacterized protein LOC109169394 [Ipomoea nil]
MRELVSGALAVAQAEDFGKYLGLPSVVGKNRRAVFAYVEQKLRQRFGSWNKRLLSKAGKEVLLKSVAQAMPTYTMSIYLLPSSLCVSLERLMNRYWWGRAGDEGGIHWLAWDRMCKPKKFGGMRFKRLREFNLALLGKQGWRLLTNPCSLMARVFKARRRIGNGSLTKIWTIPWLPDAHNPYVESDQIFNNQSLLVLDLISAHTGRWNGDLLHQLFNPRDVMLISQLPIQIPSFANRSFLQWSEEWLGGTSGIGADVQGRICGILHAIWTARNSAVWEGCMPTPCSLLRRFSAAWTTWTECEQRRQQACSRNSILQPTPPTATSQVPMSYRCYGDAGFHGTNHSAAFGFIVLDGDSSFVAAANGSLSCQYDPPLAEAMALCEALSWLKDNGYSGGRLYTDSSVLVSGLECACSFRNYFGFILLSCNRLINAMPGTLFCFVNMEANHVAHSLSKHVSAVAGRYVWRDFPPAFIQPLVANII